MWLVWWWSCRPQGIRASERGGRASHGHSCGGSCGCGCGCGNKARASVGWGAGHVCRVESTQRVELSTCRRLCGSRGHMHTKTEPVMGRDSQLWVWAWEQCSLRKYKCGGGAGHVCWMRARAIWALRGASVECRWAGLHMSGPHKPGLGRTSLSCRDGWGQGQSQGHGWETKKGQSERAPPGAKGGQRLEYGREGRASVRARGRGRATWIRRGKEGREKECASKDDPDGMC